MVVGRVESVTARPEDVRGASSTLKIDNGYQFSKDTIASILTSGLLGEVYIGLEAGGDPVMLADGGRIGKTQSAVVLEKLISQFLFDKASQRSGQVTHGRSACVRRGAALAARVRLRCPRARRSARPRRTTRSRRATA